ncbi:hypothetical protein DFH11DRAFT_1728834 [Phellopilus nigrolimitatus]|nr:hypothetical protein DFH11DRAFT_1728834 [Phellopilus nigrolimitatus]
MATRRRRRLHVVCTSSPSHSPSSYLLFCSAWLAVELEKKKELSGVDKAIHGGDQQQHTAIQLSHLLLHAILMNHIAHSEATKVAKDAEQQLRSRLAGGNFIHEKLDSDLCRHKNLLAAKTQEITSLHSDLSRLKGSVIAPTRRQSLSAPTSPDGYFSFSSAVQHTHRWARARPGPCPSPMSFPGSPNGTSSASATAAALQHPASPSPASCAYHHTRSASMMQHRATTPAPAVHTVSSFTLSSGSRRGAMIPAAVHQRSASQAGSRSSRRDARRAVGR